MRPIFGSLLFLSTIFYGGNLFSGNGPDLCDCTVVANVVALNQPWQANRLGTATPNGRIFALRRDVVPADTPIDANGKDVLSGDPIILEPGNVRLRSDKRPRPMVLRVNEGECLEIHFENLLVAEPDGISSLNDPVLNAGIHVNGLELVPVEGQEGTQSDGTFVGANPSGFAAPGGTIVYKLYARKQGVYFMFSDSGYGSNGIEEGLFGAVNVQPPRGEYYRSQVTREQLLAATLNANKLPASMSLEPALEKSGQRKRTREGRELWTLISVGPDGKEQQSPTVIDEAGYLNTEMGQPLINYMATYEDGTPVLRMDWPNADNPKRRILCYTDLTAMITGPNAGRWPYTIVNPSFYENPASPDRRQPFREFTIMYHQLSPIQSFPEFNTGPETKTLKGGEDLFGINYGVAGIAAEILANRIGAGPEGFHGDEVDLKFEEFFLSSWAVGDPAMIVDVPANAPNNVLDTTSTGGTVIDEETLDNTNNGIFEPLSGERATKAFYPDDPSNVYHSYLRDHVKFRIINAGSVKEPPHVHHLHAHQWLHSPNSDDGHYLDSQLISSGSTYTAEITYNGSGNRNQTVGDSIFHCHFYPHFAEGMWSLWRVHDVIETGTILNSDGTVKTEDEEGNPLWNRSLPDGEIITGTPIPAIVPLPTLGMAPVPALVRVSNANDPTIDGLDLAGRRAIVQPVLDPDGNPVMDGDEPLYENPGYPFFIPGIAGHRPPHPPLDYAWVEDENGEPVLDENGERIYLDGGLPRHQVLTGEVVRNLFTRWDFSKDFILFSTDNKKEQTQETYLAGNLVAYEIPQNGTAVEKAAMRFHATRTHHTYQPNGFAGNFTTNGLPPEPGAPYAAPAVDENGNSVSNLKRYKAANIQLDVVLNKKGWHYPQQRILALWYDVAPTIQGERPPEPFFFRSHTGDTIEYWHTNLVPNYYDLDDFQVRTPTDILGQHIHLVKFDVTSSDGAENGFNYEDGTFSPDEVRERIIALNNNGKGASGGIYLFDPATQFASTDTKNLTIQPYEEYYPFFGPAPFYQNWDGAQTTIQKWDTDPLLNDMGEDRTLRTVFTHDHFSPSTHQQVGLYAGMLVEPESSNWFTNGPSFSAPGTYVQQLADGSLQTYESLTGELVPATQMFTRPDGGPTSWQAMIQTAHLADSYREFMVEFQDMQLAYLPQSTYIKQRPDQLSTVSSLFTLTIPSGETISAGPVPSWMSDCFLSEGVTLSDEAMVVTGQPSYACTACGQVELTTGSIDWTVVDMLVDTDAGPCPTDVYPIDNSNNVYVPCIEPGWPDPSYAINPPGGNGAVPNPSLISFGPNGTYSVNYTNEPIPTRVDTSVSFSGSEEAVNLAYAFTSIERLDDDLNIQPLASPIDSTVTTDCQFDPTQPTPFCYPLNPLNANVSNWDPYTPIMNAYQTDNIQVRTLVGAHFVAHPFQIHGTRWLFEPSSSNSGYRALQGMGISEHFEMLFEMPASDTGDRGFSDFLYQPNSADGGNNNGLWGLMRAYTGDPLDNPPPGVNYQASLPKLPNNPDPASRADLILERWEEVRDTFQNYTPRFKALPPNYRRFHVVATTAAQVLQNVSGGVLTYNSRGQVTANSTSSSPASFDGAAIIADPYALMYVLKEDLEMMDEEYVLKNGVTPEPMIIRANAGDWIEVTLENRFQTGEIFSFPTDETTVDDLDATTPTLSDALLAAFAANGIVLDPGSTTITATISGCSWSLATGAVTYYIVRQAGAMTVYDENTAFAMVKTPIPPSPYGGNLSTPCLTTSSNVGLNPQLVSQDIANSNGFNLGFNPDQTAVPFGDSQTYYWYAGSLSVATGELVETPIEFGAVNLRAAEPMEQYRDGMYAALIVEPLGAEWEVDAGQRAVATVYRPTSRTTTDFLTGTGSRELLFREFVVLSLEGAFLWEGASDGSFSAYNNGAGRNKLYNYRVEPMAYRYPTSETPTGAPPGFDIYNRQSNTIVMTDPSNIYSGDPQTPIFHAPAGLEARVRFLYASGKDQDLLLGYGHGWQEEPYINDSTEIGDNELSQQLGTQQVLAFEPVNMVFPSAGGAAEVTGDYLISEYNGYWYGNWSLMRVSDDLVTVTRANSRGDNLWLRGLTMSGDSLAGGVSVSLSLLDASGNLVADLGAVTSGDNGSWFLVTQVSVTAGDQVCATINGGACDRPDGSAATVPIHVPTPAMKTSAAKADPAEATGGR